MEKVHQFISSHQQSIEKSLLCRLLQELVRIPTVNPPGNRYPEMVDFLADYARSLGLTVEIHQVPTAEAVVAVPHADDYPRLNLIARWDVGAKKTIHFNILLILSKKNWIF